MTVTGPDSLVATRRSLHGVAELVLAGPQFRASGDIRLRVAPGGFRTVADPDLRVAGGELVTGSGRVPMSGRTYRALAASAGVVAGAPQDVYSEGSGVAPEDTVTLDPEALRTIIQAFVDGDQALREFAPRAEPVLWPEHFDLAIALDDINYGVSPGDAYLAEPYAYVGPFEPRKGPFWNAPFGACRPIRDLGGASAILTFFHIGREQAG